MAKTQILDYYIHLADKSVVDTMNAFLRQGVAGAGAWPAGVGAMIFVPRSDGPDTFPVTLVKGENCIRRAPGDATGGAAVEFAIDAGLYPPALPVVNVGDAPPVSGNYLSSPWFTPSTDFDRTVAQFTRSSGWWIFGSNTTFYWAGHVVWTPTVEAPGTSGAFITEPAPIRGPRHWIDGMENVAGGDGAADNSGGDHVTGAARRVGSIGFAPRSNSASGMSRNHTPPNGLTQLWEKFYFSWDATYATTEMDVWRGQVFAVGGSGGKITATPTGRLALYGTGDGTNFSLIGTTPVLPILDANGRRAKYRIDVLVTTDTSTTPSNWTADVYVNRVLVVQGAQSISGLAGNHTITTSIMGKGGGTTDGHYFVDDWVAAPIPYTKDPTLVAWDSGTGYVGGEIVRDGGAVWKSILAGTNKPPASNADGVATPAYWRKLSDSTDWLRGWQVRHVRPNANAASFSGWAGPGDFRLLGQKIAGQAGNTALTSSTALALASFTTDIGEVVDSLKGAIGWAALKVNAFLSAGGAPDGRLGYKIGGAAAVLQTITQGAGVEWHAEPVYPTGDLANPVTATAVELHHEKANDATAATLAVLNAQVEVLGVWAPEDVADDDPDKVSIVACLAPQRAGAHLTPYDQSPWADAQIPFSPVIITTGQYAGNGTGQDLSFPGPPVLLWIRANTGGTGGIRWWSSCLGPHRNSAEGAGHVSSIARPRQDFAFVSGGPGDDQQMRFLVSIVGADTQANAAGVVYSYLAIMDPGGRFFRAGAFNAAPNTVPYTHPLDDPAFLAEWSFLFKESESQTTTITLNYKTPAHAADEAAVINAGTPIANALTHQLGSLVARAGLVTNDTYGSHAYFLIRRDDGNVALGLDVRRVVRMGSYVGDGTASRTISVDMNARRPMWAIVCPANATSIYRDPNNTGSNSQNTIDTNTTTGITGCGVDSFSVGSTLNANGITYHWLVFPGCTGAGNNGWSTLCESVPVPSDSPGDTDPPIEIDGGGGGGGTVEPPDDMTTDLATTCITATTRLANQALSKLGVTTLVGAGLLGTEQSREAEQIRLHWGSAVEATLRRHTWGFAKRYADLVWIAGTEDAPYSEDWIYAYRQPAKCVRARRIVEPGVGRQFDPDPPQFVVSSDDTSDTIQSNALILTDQNDDLTAATPTAVLEYTHRVNCPAGSGDALYRQALMWKLAELIGPGLSRDAKLVAACAQMFEITIREAEAVTSDERQLPPGGEASWMTERD